jgi:murein DD-endopeptidase MepM/ murein hydrolase activator NlpD
MKRLLNVVPIAGSSFFGMNFRRIVGPVAAILFVLQFLSVEAMAHVRGFTFNHLDRKMEAGKQGSGNTARLEDQDTNEAGLVKPGRACGLSSGADRLFVDSTFSGSVRGAPALSKVRLDGTNDEVHREVLSLVGSFDAVSDIVQVVESVSSDGVSCPLYISVSRGGFEQTFWRFAPDDEPEGWFDEVGRRHGDAALATPKPGSRMSSPFGPRRYYGRLSGGGFHNGIDYEAQIGQPIIAAADGIIEHQGGYFEYGLTVKIRHAAQFTTLYAHLSRFAAGIAVGSRVEKGQVIGYIGMTGRSTGAHLHFSTIVNGRFVDPASYLSSSGDRSLSVQGLAVFRQWQDFVRAAVKDTGAPPPRHQRHDVDWTTRI